MMKKMAEKKKSFHDFYETKIKEIMLTETSKILCVEENTDVTGVLFLLQDTDHVWVTDGKESAQVIGVITESDTLPLLSPPVTSLQTFDKADSHSLQYGITLSVGEVMSKNPMTSSPDETIKEVLLKMKEQKIKHLPVIDENSRLIGEISLHQLIKEYSKQQGENIPKEKIEIT
jgi:CBS domain-containing protein